MRFIISIALMASAFCAQAQSHQSGLEIKRIWFNGTGVFLSLYPKPTDCEMQYYDTHAVMPEGNFFEEQYSLLLTAYTTNKTIDIWYDDQGGCSTASSLLRINYVGLTAGQ